MSAVNIGLKCLKSCTLTLALAAPHAQAQQSVPFNGAIPLAPPGVTVPSLGDGPFHYETGEGMDINVSVYARVVFPTSMVFLPGGDKLVSTRRGEVWLIRNDEIAAKPVPGTPEAVWGGIPGQVGAVHGYMDIVLHPDFDSNGYVYISYTKAGPDRNTLAVGRGTWDGTRINGFTDIYNENAGGPGRLAFGRDDKLYLTSSGADPQDLSSPGGKVMRLNDDGSFPADNPFADTPGAFPGVYTYGHRNGLGLALHPVTGEMWQNENGPNGGDEINILEPGANYGWPVVSLGRTYPGPWQSDTGMPTHEGYKAPVAYWMPAIAASGMAFYRGDELPKWKGDVFVGALRTGEIPGTGHIERILFNENMEELRRESLLTDLHLRVRDVKAGPDGYIYVLTDEDANGAILRIEPAE